MYPVDSAQRACRPLPLARHWGYRECMNVLVLHRNFPGQFRHICRHLARTGHRVVAVGNAQAPGLPGITLVRYDTSKLNLTGHRHLGTVTSGVAHGELVAHILLQVLLPRRRRGHGL